MEQTVWVVELNDPVLAYGEGTGVLGVYATEDSALASVEEAGGQWAKNVAEGGGFSDPDSPFETEADGTWHAGLADGGEVTVTPWRVNHPLG